MSFANSCYTYTLSLYNRSLLVSYLKIKSTILLFDSFVNTVYLIFYENKTCVKIYNGKELCKK